MFYFKIYNMYKLWSSITLGVSISFKSGIILDLGLFAHLIRIGYINKR